MTGSKQPAVRVFEVDKIGSATSPLALAKTVGVVDSSQNPRAGDVVVGFDHPNYGHMAVMPPAVRQALSGDFS